MSESSELCVNIFDTRQQKSVLMGHCELWLKRSAIFSMWETHTHHCVESRVSLSLRVADEVKLTVKASVCSSGSISTSSGGCSMVSSSRGWGWDRKLIYLLFTSFYFFLLAMFNNDEQNYSAFHYRSKIFNTTFSSISYSTPKMGFAEYTLCKELISFTASCNLSIGSILNPSTYPPV